MCTNKFGDDTNYSYYISIPDALPKFPRRTDFEISILRVLWKRGPSTVREIQEQTVSETSYRTVLKMMMQLMAEKGLLVRNVLARTHIYKPAQPAEEKQGQLIRDVVGRASNGSPMSLSMQALSARKTELRKLIDEAQRSKK
jgi:predicted transcriptional regulator